MGGRLPYDVTERAALRNYYLAGEIIVSAIFKYRGMDWSALRKLSLTVAFALTIITPDTVVLYELRDFDLVFETSFSIPQT